MKIGVRQMGSTYGFKGWEERVCYLRVDEEHIIKSGMPRLDADLNSVWYG